MPRAVASNNKAMYLNGSMGFNGSNTYIDIPSSASINSISTEATVAVRLRRKTAQSTANEYIAIAGTKWYYRIDSLTGGLLRFYYNGNNSILNGPRIKAGRDEHVVTTLKYNGSNITGSMYINGSLFGTQNQAGTTVAITGDSIRIGASPTNSFNGNLSDFSVWNRELTAQEIADWYYHGIKPTNGLVVATKVDDMTGTTVVDSSDNANNGTATNYTWSTIRPFAPRTIAKNDIASLSFDSTTSYGEVTTGIATTYNLQNNFTISTEVNARSLAAFARFIAKNFFGAGGYAFGSSASGFLQFTSLGVLDYTSTYKIPLNKFVKLGVKMDSSNCCTFYADGQKVAYVAGASPCGLDPTSTLTFGCRINAGRVLSEGFNGFIKSLYIFNTSLSDIEMMNFHTLGKVPRDNLIGEWLVDDGGGSTAYNTSTELNHATLSGTTWTNSIAAAIRQVVGANLVKNGDLSHVPVVNTPTTGSPAWIDGTAGGSSTNSIFGWAFVHDTTSSSVVFDTTVLYNQKPSIKISTTTKGGGSYVFADKTFNLVSSGNPSSPGAIKCKPNTDYVYTAMIKTLGAGVSQGARLFVQTKNNIGTAVQTLRSTGGLVIGTQEWTRVSINFTTGSSENWLRVLVLAGEGSDVVDGMSVWYADMTLEESAKPPLDSRLTINTNMVKNGDFAYVPAVNNAKTSGGSSFLDGTASGSPTNASTDWSAFINVSASAFFDTTNLSPLGSNSLKISLTGAGSYIEVFKPSAVNGLLGYYVVSKIKVSPSTSYTWSFYMKTNYVSGDSNDGVRVAFIPSNSVGATAGGGASSTTIKTTTGWTKYTGTFTTTATSRYLQINPLIYGHTGAATLVMDAWISNIVVTPTTPNVRAVV